MEKPPQQDKKEYQFEQKDGIRKRLTLESAISADTETLIDLQSQLKNEISNFYPTPIEETHFTIGHLGKVDELYEELSARTPNIDKGVFEQELQELLSNIENLVSEKIDTNATEIKIFESGAVVLVINKEDIKSAQLETFNAVLNFLNTVGINNPEEYIKSSTPNTSNLHFLLPDRWTPHITLGWIKDDERVLQQSEKTIKNVSVPVQIQPSYVRNAHH